MYYPVFIDWMHLTFEEAFRVLRGEDYYRRLIEERRIGFPVVTVSGDYVRPLRFGSRVDCEMKVEKMGRSSTQLKYRFYTKDGTHFEGGNTCVTTSLDRMRSLETPTDLRRLFDEIGN